jgi:hypothetical protein
MMFNGLLNQDKIQIEVVESLFAKVYNLLLLKLIAVLIQQIIYQVMI